MPPGMPGFGAMPNMPGPVPGFPNMTAMPMGHPPSQQATRHARRWVCSRAHAGALPAPCFAPRPKRHPRARTMLHPVPQLLVPPPLPLHACRVYVGGLPPTATEQSIATFFSSALAAIGGNSAGPGEWAGLAWCTCCIALVQQPGHRCAWQPACAAARSHALRAPHAPPKRAPFYG